MKQFRETVDSNERRKSIDQTTQKYSKNKKELP
jgi:hypothetical protein